ncbi:MAG: hypothetical protein AVO35_01710 [Candidatus Aegiribacteria sp. MLS_C]|nr:MAG: hypothetical protein AVO35_01710 [Candidatus Aegiribacteria sp. MLS_C]
MFDIEVYNEKWNDQEAERYGRDVGALRDFLEGPVPFAGEGGSFVSDLCKTVLRLADLEREMAGTDFEDFSLSELERIDRELFRWMEPGTYSRSWSDPAVASGSFGPEAGPLLSMLYHTTASSAGAVFLHRRFQLAHLASLAVECSRCFRGDGSVCRERLDGALRTGMQEYSAAMEEPLMLCMVDPGFLFYRDIMEEADPSDPRHLYRYGRRIGKHELRTAAFFAGLEEAELESLASVIIDAFRRGFEVEGKEIRDGGTVMLKLPVGYERLAGLLFGRMADQGMVPVVHAPDATSINRQIRLDHRFDNTLWLDDDFIERELERKDAMLGRNSGMLERCCGIIMVSFFGEAPFQPVEKPEAVRPGAREMEMFRRYQFGMMNLQEKYLPRKQMSFTVISFPSPEVGGRYEEIFEAMVAVNSVDSSGHGELQDRLIRMLDGASSIHIAGRDGNRTDLTVALQVPEDTGKATVFRNCLADINIPVGEIFTSPRLRGTDGILHVEEVMLNRMKFQDLELRFSDGMTVDCTCSNFATEEEGMKFVREQLLFPHERLPAGEFAIGTNTLAYEMAMRYGIMDLLPVLIIEKMGPHLAIGDTCYAHEEDQVVRNPDGREVLARENEMSAARDEDPENAYTNTHIDISIPFHMIGAITARFPDGGALDVIRNGRFVPGELQELNGPIDRLRG